MNTGAIWFLAIAIFSTVSCRSELAKDESVYRIQSIGCLLPIPARFIMKTSSDNSYFFYDSSEESFGQIRIAPYIKAELDDLLQQSVIVSKVEKNGRVAMSILVQFDEAEPPGFPQAIFHDFNEVVWVSGDEVSNWKRIFESCLASPAPQRPDSIDLSGNRG